MSTPANPLAKFNTYSYQHVLVAYDNTNVAAELTDTISTVAFARDANDSDKYAVRTTDSGKYVILINSMTDADYRMTDITWTHINNGSIVDNDNGNSVFVKGSMTIKEPNGFVFLNTIQNVAGKLGLEPTEVGFMIKTFFVGHPTGTNTIPRYISYIRPFNFSVVKITGSVDIEGGIYNMDFVGNVNGTSYLPKNQYALPGMNIRIDPLGERLSSVLERLSLQINVRAVLYASQVALKYSGEVLSDTTDDNHNKNPVFKAVRYEIAASKELGKYIIENNSSFGNIISFGKKKDAAVTIDEAIHQIMKHVYQIRERDDEDGPDTYVEVGHDGGIDDDFDEDEEKIVKTPNVVYKIYTEIKDDENGRVVVYTIALQKTLNNIDIINKIKNNDEIAQRNVLELDYYFTGKNVDIIDLDIKMNHGLVFFSSLGTGDTITTQKQQLAVGTPVGGKVSTNSLQFNNTNPPATVYIYPGEPFSDDMTRNLDPKDAVSLSSFMSKLRQHSKMETIQMSVGIVGNPNLLDSYNGTSRTNADRSSLVFPDWDTFPSLVKVNIKTPRDKNDFSKGFEQFWMDGYFSILKIENKFSDGEFTQVLHIVAASLDDSPIKPDDKLEETETVGDDEIELYDGDLDTAPDDDNVDDGTNTTVGNMLSIITDVFTNKT